MRFPFPHRFPDLHTYVINSCIPKLERVLLLLFTGIILSYFPIRHSNVATLRGARPLELLPQQAKNLSPLHRGIINV